LFDDAGHFLSCAGSEVVAVMGHGVEVAPTAFSFKI
jgi:hypothetical protein